MPTHTYNHRCKHTGQLKKNLGAKAFFFFFKEEQLQDARVMLVDEGRDG